MGRCAASIYVAIVGVLLSGCAGMTSPGSQPALNTTDLPSRQLVAEASPQSGQVASTHPASEQQYAGVVEQHSRRLISALILLQNANLCTWIRPGEPDLQAAYFPCAGAMMQASSAASSLANVLRASQDADSESYLGTPPATVSGLVMGTIRAGDSLHRAEIDAENCVVESGPSCLGPWSHFAMMMSTMNIRLVAWEPYL
jgi:hypothetical protein